MKTTRKLSSWIPAVIAIAGISLLVSCNAGMHNKKGVERAMKKYDGLIKKLDSNAIARLYTPDGDLGGIAIGRDSIRKFLSGFKGLRVLSQVSTTNFLELYGDSSLQKGTYRQTVIIGGKDTVTVRGEYTANWQWLPGQGWHIRRMRTKPLN